MNKQRRCNHIISCRHHAEKCEALLAEGNQLEIINYYGKRVFHLNRRGGITGDQVAKRYPDSDNHSFQITPITGKMSFDKKTNDDGETITKKIKPDFEQRIKAVEDVASDSQYNISVVFQRLNKNDESMKEFFELQKSTQQVQSKMTKTVNELLLSQESTSIRLEKLGQRFQEDNKTTAQLFMEALVKTDSKNMNSLFTNLIKDNLKTSVSGLAVDNQLDDNATVASITNDITEIKEEKDVNPCTYLKSELPF